VSAQAAALWSALSQRAVWGPTLFLFALKATPSPGSAFTYFLTGELLFGPEVLGRLALAGAAASLAGVVVFQRFLVGVPAASVVWWTTVAAVVPGLLQVLLVTHANRLVGLDDGLFVLSDDAVLTALSRVAFMPTLVLAARLCPPGVEGTLFALLMSVFNAAGIVGSELGAGLTAALGVTDTDFTNLAPLIVICTLSSLLPLPFIGLISEAESGRVDGAAIEIPDDLSK
jgi:hypothetical protein